ncbi:MAG: L,D-transpeptidase family protein [Kiritimatiellae bacterium]|nr:L,D-transpeptidase family protein [Kiritimatiellia bacterium]
MQTIDDIYRKRKPRALPLFCFAALVAAAAAAFALHGCGGGETASAEAAEPAATAEPAQAGPAADAATAPEQTGPAAPAPAEAQAAAPVPSPDAPRVGSLDKAALDKAFEEAAAFEKTGKLYDARDVLLAALDRAGEAEAAELERELGRLATDIYFTPRPGPDKVVYAVKEGDSLAKLADRYVCPVAFIMRANGVKDANRIRPGQTLVFPDHPKFAVTVSKSKNTLLLTLDGKFFKRYVVGTGANAKTPAGTYDMVERIEHPGWWNDGVEIPYGDPANILGTHWLALEPTGDTPRVSGYGIHGTWDESSLGKQSSAGCVRMRNRDVEELYVLLPRGTPVLVVE